MDLATFPFECGAGCGVSVWPKSGGLKASSSSGLVDFSEVSETSSP